MSEEHLIGPSVAVAFSVGTMKGAKRHSCNVFLQQWEPWSLLEHVATADVEGIFGTHFCN
jgi:hypothetical protein